MQKLFLSLDNSTMNDFISVLAYISQIRRNILLQTELEALCIQLNKCFRNIESMKTVETILTYLEQVDKQNFITHEKFKIHINDRWFFKLILLASLRNCTELFKKKDTSVTVHQKRQVLQEAMLTFQPDRIESILILRLIETLIKKNIDVVVSTSALQLLLFSQKAAMSPFEGYRRYAHNISKITLRVLDLERMKIISDFTLLPLKGIETIEFVPYFKQASVNNQVSRNIVTKVIQMFSNNIENREGGFLYRSVVFEEFSYWKEIVWPQFFVKFQRIDFEGEFFQSLVKYWIPEGISGYKMELYTFICTEPIPTYLKGHILLEARRKGLIEKYNQTMTQLLSNLFEDNATASLALKIVSSYSRRNIYPSNIELQLVTRYLYGQTGLLENEQLKCLHRFLSQIGVVGSELYHKKTPGGTQEKWFMCYKTFVLDLYGFSLKLLETSHRDFGAQILVLFWKLTNDQSPYLLNYNIDKETTGFYSHIFQDKDLYTGLIGKALLESKGNFSELTKLGQLMSLPNKLYSNNYLLMFIDECAELNSVMAAESVKNVASIMVSQNELQKNASLLQNLFDAVTKHFQNFSLSLKSIFKGTLLFEAILEVSKNMHSQEPCKFVGFETYCLPVIEELQGITHKSFQKEITEKGNLDSSDQRYNLHCKIQKIVESLLNNVLQYILQDRTIWNVVDKKNIINILVKIIETSNMRRPTTKSADVLKHVSKLIDEEFQKYQTSTCPEIIKKKNDDMSYKIRLLHDTLQKVCEVASVQSLTIRRNPESRLIIHALCQSESHHQKPLLAATLHQLLGILSDSTSTDSTVSSAMHCAEMLISDNTLYDHTLRFVPDIIFQCVNHFENRNWVVRNADIQLMRSLIERFLGVLIGPNNRPKSIEDLFLLFPELICLFCQILLQEPWTDSTVIIMQFFSESQTKKQLMENEYMETTRGIFLRLFARVIKENRNHYGFFAVRAYISLCLEEKISASIQDIIDCVIENFAYITEKHTLRNFALLLRELYDKFVRYIEDFPMKPYDYYVIHANFDRLLMFLKQFKTKQFDLLLLKVLSTNEVTTVLQTSNFDLTDFKHRLWQHNYVPFLLINTEAARFDEILKDILFKNVLGCIQVKVLSILVDKYNRNHFSIEISERILSVLVQKMLYTDDTSTYLLLCYFKVIFLFCKCHIKITESCIEEVRRCYMEVKNVNKIFVFILVLAQVSNKNDIDKNFIRTAVQCFQNSDLTDYGMAEIVSEMLQYLYINVSCVCDKYRIFKMAVFLLVEHGLFNFVRFVTKSRISSPLIAMVKILHFDFLVEVFGSDEVACKFVKEFYDCVMINYANNNSKNENRTYYVEKKDIFINKVFIDKIILKFIRDFNRKRSNFEGLRHYELLQSQNKR